MKPSRNRILGNEYSDEWYTPANVAAKCFELLHFTPKRPLCPFDTEASPFVQYAKANQMDVQYGMRDFLWLAEYDCDAIVTNPPFSIKTDVLERCYEYGVPTVLVLPLDILGGIRRQQLFKKYGPPGVFIPERRIAFTDQHGNLRKAANFLSILLLLNMKEMSGKMVFENA